MYGFGGSGWCYSRLWLWLFWQIKGFCRSMVGFFGISVPWSRWCCESDWKVLGLGGGFVVDNGGATVVLLMMVVASCVVDDWQVVG